MTQKQTTNPRETLNVTSLGPAPIGVLALMAAVLAVMLALYLWRA